MSGPSPLAVVTSGRVSALECEIDYMREMLLEAIQKIAELESFTRETSKAFEDSSAAVTRLRSRVAELEEQAEADKPTAKAERHTFGAFSGWVDP